MTADPILWVHHEYTYCMVRQLTSVDLFHFFRQEARVFLWPWMLVLRHQNLLVRQNYLLLVCATRLWYHGLGCHVNDEGTRIFMKTSQNARPEKRLQSGALLYEWWPGDQGKNWPVTQIASIVSLSSFFQSGFDWYLRLQSFYSVDLTRYNVYLEIYGRSLTTWSE